MVFKPLPDGTRRLGLAAVLGLALLDLLILFVLFRRSPDWLSFVLLVALVGSFVLLVGMAYRTWGAFNLEYWLDRNALRVRWAASCQVIPLHAIRRVVVPDDLVQQTQAERAGEPIGSPAQVQSMEPVSTQGASHGDQPDDWLRALDQGAVNLWPSPYVRPDRHPDPDRFVSLATRPASECLLLDTDVGMFALSPEDREGFIAALQDHRRLGPSQMLAARWEEPFPCWRVLAEDRLSQVLLIAGLAGALLLFALLMVRFPTLPERLAFHYDRTGVPDSIRPKGALFLLPVIGAFAYLVNGSSGLWMACRNQRAGAYLLWVGALIVQSLTFLALANLIV